jgi:hypothetical protein
MTKTMKSTDWISKPTSETEQTADRDPRCEQCGRALNSSKPSVREVFINSVSALLLVAILIPLGWQINKAAERLSHQFVQHLLWREPLEDWRR